MKTDDLSFFEADAVVHTGETVAPDILQYLAFAVSKLQLAVSLSQVSEIVPYDEVSALPGTAPYIRGVMQLRGRTSLIVDLALKLGREPAAVTKRTCILMVDIAIGHRQVSLGIITDGVPTLLDIEAASIAPAPRLDGALEREYIARLLPSDRGMLSAIDLQRVFASDELVRVSDSLAPHPSADRGST